MEFFADFKPTSTISINPPGGTGHPNHPHHTHLPPVTEFPTPVARYLHATHTGHTALWVIFVLFTISLVVVSFMSLRVEKKSRAFHWISAAVLTFAMVSYLSMATGLGISFVQIHNHGGNHAVHLFREVYYARYIDWLFTTPLLLLSLALLAGLSPSDTLLVILFDVFMIVTGLLAGVVKATSGSGERSRWFFFAISCVGFLGIWWILITGGAKAAKQRPKKTRGLYFLLSGMTLALWTAYPIVFGLTEGANKVGVDAEIIAYGVLDVAAKIGFTFLLLGIHTHDSEDTWTLPDWFVTPRASGGLAREGRGSYGAIRSDE